MDNKNTLDQVSRDALGISSGTIAGLINNSKYYVIDQVQRDFFEFCQENAGKYETWVKAWKAFDEVRDKSLIDTPAKVIATGRMGRIVARVNIPDVCVMYELAFEGQLWTESYTETLIEIHR